MTTIRGFELPDHLYYFIEKHVWIAPRGGGLARLGMTTVGYHLLRETLSRSASSRKCWGLRCPRVRASRMVESLKYIGPIPAPFAGVVEPLTKWCRSSPIWRPRTPTARLDRRTAHSRLGIRRSGVAHR